MMENDKISGADVIFSYLCQSILIKLNLLPDINKMGYNVIFNYLMYNLPNNLNRHRVQGHLMHCNWGWSSTSDGWYFDFIPPHKPDYIYFYTEKYLYTGIKPL